MTTPDSHRHIALSPRLAALLAAAMATTAASAANLSVLALDSAGKPLADAVVFLESADASRARLSAKPLAGVEMAQVAKQFEPKVLVVPLGTSVSFPNRSAD